MQSVGDLGHSAQPAPSHQNPAKHSACIRLARWLRTRRLTILTLPHLLAQPAPAAESQSLAAFAYRVGQAFRC
jgi:hypothetical protein